MKKIGAASLKRKLAGLLATIMFVLAVVSGMPATVAEAASGKVFVHPGMLHTAVALEKIRQNVNNKVQPNLDTWNALLADGYSQTGVAPRPLETVIRGGEGQNFPQFYKDVRRAYQLALVWSINGSEEHGEKACEYLNVWSSTLKTITGNADTFLAAGIYGYELANAAELMRNHPSFDKEAMEELLLNVFYPINVNFLTNHNGAHIGNYWANWDLCNIACLMSIGIFTDREDIYNEAIHYYKNGVGMGSIYNAMPFVFDDGTVQWQESGRDQGHTVFGIGLCSAICEMAWNQGDDLYSLSDNRFLKAAEYVARYNNGYDDLQYAVYERHNGQKGSIVWCNELSAASRGQIRPIYSMVYNHYVNRMGLSAPNIKEILEPTPGQYALEVASGNGDELGWQTLTFANLSDRAEKKEIQGAFPDGIYRITSALTGKSLVVNGEGNLASATKGTKSEEWWKLENLGDGDYIITNTVTNKVMQVNGDYYTRGAVIGTGSRSNSLNQKFAFMEDGTGIFRIVSSVSTHVVDLLDAGTADDTTIIQWKYLRGTNQQWQIEASTANNAYEQLRTKTEEAKAIALGNYDIDSYVSLQTVIAESEKMLSEMTAAESAVSEKAKQLTNAINALQKASNLVDLSKMSVTLSNKNAGANAQEAGIASIFDGNADTFIDVRNVTDAGTSGAGGYIIFDMGEENEIILDKVAMMARNDRYSTRLKGAVIQGSNNGTDWTTITATALGNLGWQKVAVTNNTTAYRYLKLYNAGNWYGNIAELRVYGKLQNGAYDELNAKITEAKAIVIGSYDVDSYINLQTVIVEAETMYAERTASESEVNAKVAALSKAVSGLKKANNLVDLSNFAVTLSNKGAGANAQEAGITALFDGNADSWLDVRNVTDAGTSGAGGYIIFDAGEGKECVVDKVAMVARNDQYYTRLKGTVIQGSNNGTDWTTITATAVGNPGWQKVAVTDNTTAYRYLKVYNASNWFGNISELRIYGKVQENAYEALETKLAEAKAITFNNYDIDAYLNLQTVIGEADVMLAEKTAAASEVLAKVAQLTSAVSGLKTANNLIDLSNMAVTLSNKGAGANAQAAGITALFDGNADTWLDVRNVTDAGTSGAGGYIIFDAGEGKECVVDKVAMVARNDQYYTRLKGTVLQGSNNGTDWTDITVGATGSLGWQKVAVTDNSTAYRYLKVYNWSNWFGNIAELRVYGTVQDIPYYISSADILADFTFDADGSGFTSGSAVATGTYSLQSHENGNALYLNGTSDFLQVQTTSGTSLLSGLNEFTVSFDVKPETKDANWMFYAAPNANAQTYLREKYLGVLANKAGVVTAERYNNSGARPGSVSASAATNDWYHVTIVYAGTESILYINGEEVSRQASQYSVTDILGDNSVVYIGKANWGNGEYFKGLLDNYKIIKRTLTPDEIRALAQ